MLDVWTHSREFSSLGKIPIIDERQCCSRMQWGKETICSTAKLLVFMLRQSTGNLQMNWMPQTASRINVSTDAARENRVD